MAKGLEFEERDIAQDPSSLADLKKLGYMTTPAIVINGAVIVGFDAEKIEQGLKELATDVFLTPYQKKWLQSIFQSTVYSIRFRELRQQVSHHSRPVRRGETFVLRLVNYGRARMTGRWKPTATVLRRARVEGSHRHLSLTRQFHGNELTRLLSSSARPRPSVENDV